MALTMIVVVGAVNIWCRQQLLSVLLTSGALSDPVLINICVLMNIFNIPILNAELTLTAHAPCY